MSATDVPTAIVERLSRVRSMEVGLIDRLDALRASGAGGAEAAAQFDRMAAVASGHVQTLDELLAGTGQHSTNETAQPLASAVIGQGASSVEDLAGAAAATIAAYGSLYAAARLLYQDPMCDFADASAAEWVRETRATFDLLPSVVIGELLDEGLTCRCICPACGIGACLCMRTSIATIRAQWGQPGLEPGEGIELRIPPPPGSQLAEAGLDQGDRVVSVDGEVVHVNADLQRALRRRPFGEPMPMEVLQGRDRRRIQVMRVSDFPS
jgi:hypothetical protein